MSTPQFPRGNPLAPEKGAFPLDRLRGVHRDEREVSGVFASASVLLGARSRGLFLFLSLSLSLSLSLFLSLSLSFSGLATTTEGKSDSNKCKRESKLYSECRMANEPMAEQPFARRSGFERTKRRQTGRHRPKQNRKQKNSKKKTRRRGSSRERDARDNNNGRWRRGAKDADDSGCCLYGLPTESRAIEGREREGTAFICTARMKCVLLYEKKHTRACRGCLARGTRVMCFTLCVASFSSLSKKQ